MSIRNTVNLPLIIILLTLFITGGTAQAQQSKKTIWKKISPYFSPPKELKNEFGDYPSPLVFEDGKKVKTSDDWKKRRQEILNEWHQMMGEWPALLEDQEMTILKTEQREDFTQHTIRFEWVPGQE